MQTDPCFDWAAIFAQQDKCRQSLEPMLNWIPRRFAELDLFRRGLSVESQWLSIQCFPELSRPPPSTLNPQPFFQVHRQVGFLPA